MSNAAKMWQCDRCGANHGFDDDARDCCRPEISVVFVCAECEEEHDTQEGGDACCAETKILSDTEIRAELEDRGQMRLIE